MIDKNQNNLPSAALNSRDNIKSESSRPKLPALILQIILVVLSAASAALSVVWLINGSFIQELAGKLDISFGRYYLYLFTALTFSTALCPITALCALYCSVTLGKGGKLAANILIAIVGFYMAIRLLNFDFTIYSAGWQNGFFKGGIAVQIFIQLTIIMMLTKFKHRKISARWFAAMGLLLVFIPFVLNSMQYGLNLSVYTVFTFHLNYIIEAASFIIIILCTMFFKNAPSARSYNAGNE